MAGVGGSLGSSGPSGPAGCRRAGSRAAAAPAVASASLIERTLGRTGLKIPVVSMGVMNASAPALVEASYRQGVRHFDTAWFYQRGMNETMVGDVVKQLGCRDQVVIGTKIYLKETERDLYQPGIKSCSSIASRRASSA